MNVFLHYYLHYVSIMENTFLSQHVKEKYLEAKLSRIRMACRTLQYNPNLDRKAQMLVSYISHQYLR